MDGKDQAVEISPVEWFKFKGINIQYHSGRGDDAYLDQEFSSLPFEYGIDSILMCINERLAALLTVVSNIMVVSVFLRVLGLNRTASKVIVNMAAANFVVAFDLLLHAQAVTDKNLGGSKESCRLTYLFHVSACVVERGCMSVALMERLLALNMPRYHTDTLPSVLLPLILAPWIYWVLLLIMSYEGFFQFNMGFGCLNHLNQEPMDITVELLQIFSSCLAAVLFLCLVMSRLMHSPHADDAWELNRQKMEMKTATIIGQVFVLDAALYTPYIIAHIVAYHLLENIYATRTIAHICKQIGFYSGCLIFLVLLCRKELRKAFILLFASNETIRRSHQVNYLLAASINVREKKKSLQLSVIEEEEIRVPLPEPSAREDTQSFLDHDNTSEWLGEIKKKT